MRPEGRTKLLANTICSSLLSLFVSIPFAALAQQPMIVADDGTRGISFRSQVGRILTFVCPSTLNLNQDIWGTDVYTDESAVCKAAVHAGVLIRGTPGQVTILMGSGADSFPSAERNGVTSLSYGRWDSTYSFVPNTEAGQIDWSTTYDLVPDNFNSTITVFCPPNGKTDTAVWGTDVYSASSAICPAAVHAGAITLAAGGRVTLTLQPKQETFVASARNGISSLGWSSWEYPFHPKPYKPTPGAIPVMVPTPLPALRSEPNLSSASPPDVFGPRKLTLAGFTATGTATPLVPRMIGLPGFTAGGIGIPILPRTITASGFSATGTATPIVPRTVPLTGWNSVGAPTTP
jgi:LCCL domain-containing protein